MTDEKKHWFNHAACSTTGYRVALMVWDIFPASFQQRLCCLPTFLLPSLLSLYRNHLHVLQQATNAWSVRDILCWVIANSLFSEGPLDYPACFRNSRRAGLCSMLHCIIYFYECRALARYNLYAGGAGWWTGRKIKELWGHGNIMASSKSV